MGQYLRYGRIDPAQKMAIRNSIFQVEKIEQLALIDCLPPHHDPPPPLTESSESESWFAGTHEHFFNSIGQIRSFGDYRLNVRFGPLCGLKSESK
jgi:hypothetical protein